MAGQQLTKQDEGFLNFIEQMWSLSGELPSKDMCSQYGFTAKDYGLLRRPAARTNLIARGISEAAFRNIDGLSNGGSAQPRLAAISERQLTAVAVMLDPHDRRSKSKRLNECGVSTGEWSAWLKDQTFRDYLNKRGELLLGEYFHEADYALVQKVRTGDIGAIKYFNEYTGRFIPESQRNSSAASNGFDPKSFIIRVMEAVQKHCTPEQQQAIGSELLDYAQVAGFASRIIENLEPINIPIPGTQEQPVLSDTGILLQSSQENTSSVRPTERINTDTPGSTRQHAKQPLRELIAGKLKEQQAGGL